MKVKVLVGLASLGTAGAVLSNYLLQQRPRELRYAASGAVFLLPFGIYRLAGRAEKPRTTFLFITDTHGRANPLLIKTMLQENDVDFVAHGGDIVDGEEWWRVWWDVPFAPIIQRWTIYPSHGNHDPEAGFRQRFPDRWPPYKISADGVDIFVIPFETRTNIAPWLDRETAASTAPAKILITHRPIWAASGEEANLSRLLAASLPRINLVLAGHQHVFWDYIMDVQQIGVADSRRPVRQIIEVSGPKKYRCNSTVKGCVERSTGFLRIEVYSDRIVVKRRIVPA